MVTTQNPNTIVKKYVIGGTRKLTRSHLNTLRQIHESLGWRIASMLTDTIDEETKIRISSVREISSDVVQNSNTQSCMIIIFSKTLNSEIILELPHTLVYNLINKLLGGVSSKPPPKIVVGEIEANILSTTMEEFDCFVQEAWGDNIDLNISPPDVISSIMLKYLVEPSDDIVTTEYCIRLGEYEDIMKCHIKSAALIRIGKQLILGFENYKKTEITDENIKLHVKDSKVNIKGILGDISLTFKDISNLSKGDILPLNKTMADKISVFVEDNEFFNGYYGKSSGKHAIKVVDMINKEQFKILEGIKHEK